MRPLRPFPLALGVGTDICRVARIHAILGGPRRHRFARRILAPEELAAAGGALPLLAAGGGRAPAPAEELWKTAVFVAGRFAAKEAAFKAHAHRRLGWHDVIIERLRDGGDGGRSGPPVARIRSGDAAADDESALVSISHDGEYATAVCIAYNGGDGAA